MNTRGLSAYAALGLPLAMAALPIYVAAPQFYGAELGLDLAMLGSVLFFARLVDTAQDPWLGRWVDASQHRPQGWPGLMRWGSAALALGLYALFSPPTLAAGWLYAWLALCLVLVYIAHSVVNIAYLAWGTRLSDQVDARARISAWREGAGLLGVVLASVLPVVLVQTLGAQAGYAWFSLLFAALLAVALYTTLGWSPTPQLAPKAAPTPWRTLLAPPAVRRLCLVYLLNATAVAIPATLVLFYVADVLRAPEASGWLLASYFVSGALALPAWVYLAARLGKARAWLLGMLLGASAFCWAALLGPGDTWQFALVCILSGGALGADLALPPALLADLIPAEHRHDTGGYFGLWAMLGKLALALSAGVGLPLLSWLGYVPGQQQAAAALALVYAGLPCVLKLLSGALLLGWHGRLAAAPLLEKQA